MKNFRKKAEQFFEDYAALFQEALSGKEADVEGTANSFANCFIAASPSGIRCSANNEEFRQAIPKGYEFYKSIGTKSMKIGSKEITLLDDKHAMIKIHWLSEYLKKDNSLLSIDFDVFYFVQYVNGAIKIFSYITGDEQKILKENGLPEE
jgi:hypothetical protein